ncbi:MAG: MT-A70 family methyltransferase [Planctomycetota bacterium]
MKLYDVIVADPPWRYSFSRSGSRAVENHYSTMTQSEIEALEVPAKEDAVLYLWATAPKLPEAISALKAWGFDYKTCAMWDKRRIGMGYWFRGQHELLLVGKRGSFRPPSAGQRVSSVITETRRDHSRKPERVMELIDQWYGDKDRLELFARGAPRRGWDAWGDEVSA